MSVVPGTRIGVYEIIAAIGAGGMGEVYRARDTRLGRDVAIKVVSESVGHDPARGAVGSFGSFESFGSFYSFESFLIRRSLE